MKDGDPMYSIARFSETDELVRLGHAVDAREAPWPEAAATIRLPARTGCLHGEVLNLHYVDARHRQRHNQRAGQDRATLPLHSATLSGRTPPRHPVVSMTPLCSLYPRDTEGRGIITDAKARRETPREI